MCLTLGPQSAASTTVACKESLEASTNSIGAVDTMSVVIVDVTDFIILEWQFRGISISEIVYFSFNNNIFTVYVCTFCNNSNKHFNYFSHLYNIIYCRIYQYSQCSNASQCLHPVNFHSKGTRKKFHQWFFAFLMKLPNDHQFYVLILPLKP